MTRLTLPRPLLIRLLRIASAVVFVGAVLMWIGMVGLLIAQRVIVGDPAAPGLLETLTLGLTMLVYPVAVSAVVAIVLQGLAQIVEDGGAAVGTE